MTQTDATSLTERQQLLAYDFVAKHKLVAQCENLRANSWDAQVGGWLNAHGEPLS